MKQRYVILLGAGSLFLPTAIFASFGLSMSYIPIAMLITILGLSIARKAEVNNVNSGEVDLSKQSKGNKLVTYSLATLFFLIFVVPIVVKIADDFF